MSNESKKENVILEAKIPNQNKKNMLKLNEEHVAIDIAKSLIQDFTFIVTMTCVRAVLKGTDQRKEIVENLHKVWEKRVSAQLSMETKQYQDAIMQAFSEQKEVNQNTTEEMNKYLQSYANVRDKAYAMAKDAVQDIKKMILSDDNVKTTTDTPDTESAPQPDVDPSGENETKKETTNEEATA